MPPPHAGGTVCGDAPAGPARGERSEGGATCRPPSGTCPAPVPPFGPPDAATSSAAGGPSPGDPRCASTTVPTSLDGADAASTTTNPPPTATGRHVDPSRSRSTGAPAPSSTGRPPGTAGPPGPAPPTARAHALAQLRPGPDELADLWRQLVDALRGLARHGLAHGDLSAYNLLVHRPDGASNRLVLIDLPQVVDVVGNPRGPAFLVRDVARVTGWFAARGLPSAAAGARRCSTTCAPTWAFPREPRPGPRHIREGSHRPPAVPAP